MEIGNDTNLPADFSEEGQGQLSQRGKLMLWLLLLLIPLLFLGLLEGALRLSGFGDDLQLATRVEEDGREWWQINPDVSRRYFAAHAEFARSAEEMRIPVVKPENGLRLVCLGGSSMAGFPYNFNATMPGILYTYLKKLYPQRPVEVVNLGIAAVNSFAVRDLMPDVLALQPDAVLIYAGHNEFYGALGVGSGFSLGNSRTLINLSLKLQRFRSYLLLQRSIFTVARWIRGEADIDPHDATPVMKRMAAQQQIPFTSDLVKQAGENLRHNLADAIAAAKREEVPVFLGTLVSNLRDHPPFIAAPSRPLSADEQAQWQEQWEQVQSALAQSDSSAAILALQEALSIDSTRADLHFALGRMYLPHHPEKARAAFQKARDFDLLRFRAPGFFNRIIAEVAEQSGAVRVDVESEFNKHAAANIPGSDLISEHLHPRPQGYALMARAFLDAMRGADFLQGKFLSQRIAALPIDPAQLNITPLDLWVGRLRIRQLTSAWPFKTPVDLPVDVPAEQQKMMTPIALKYIKQDLFWGQAHLAYARQLVQRGNPEAALAEMRAVLAYYPEIFLGENEFGLWERLVETEMSAKLYEDAEIDAARAMGRFPDNPRGALLLGKTLLAQRRFKEAERALARTMEINKRHPAFSDAERSTVLYLWGAAMANQKKLIPARKKLARAMQLDPGNKNAQNLYMQVTADLERGGK